MKAALDDSDNEQSVGDLYYAMFGKKSTQREMRETLYTFHGFTSGSTVCQCCWLRIFHTIFLPFRFFFILNYNFYLSIIQYYFLKYSFIFNYPSHFLTFSTHFTYHNTQYIIYISISICLFIYLSLFIFIYLYYLYYLYLYLFIFIFILFILFILFIV